MSTDNVIGYTSRDIGKHITRLRKAKGISMYQLSLDSGISNSVLMRIEKGQRQAMISTLLKIIDGLGITPSDFFKSFK